MVAPQVSKLIDSVYSPKSGQSAQFRRSLHELYAVETEMTAQRFVGRRSSQEPLPVGNKEHCYRMFQGPVIDTVVVISIAQMGISLDFHGDHLAWHVTEGVIAAIFFLELMVNLFIEGTRFFRNIFNVTDAVVACTAVVDALISTIVYNRANMDLVKLVKLLRLLRLLRILKLLRIFPSLRAMASSILVTLQPMMTLFVLMGVVVYVFAIPCVVMLGSADAGYSAFSSNEKQLQEQEAGQFNNYKFFGTMARSMITLFHLSMQSDELVTVMRATSQIQHWPPLFFIFFVLLMTLCLFNTVIGVVVDRTVSSLLFNDERSTEVVDKQMATIQNLAGLMFEMDSDGDETLSLEEFNDGAKDPRLNNLLLEIKLPFGFTVEELFAILDVSCRGKITRKEFIGGLFRIAFSDEVQRECLLRLGQAHQRQGMLSIKEQLILEIRAEHRQLASEMRAMMRHIVHTKADKESSSTVDELPLTGEQTASCYSKDMKIDEFDLQHVPKPFHTSDHDLANRESEKELANISNGTIARQPSRLLHEHPTVSPNHLTFFAKVPKLASLSSHKNNFVPLTDPGAQREECQCGSNSEIHPPQSAEKQAGHMQTQGISMLHLQESCITGTAVSQKLAPTDEPIDVERYPVIEIQMDDGMMRASI